MLEMKGKRKAVLWLAILAVVRFGCGESSSGGSDGKDSGAPVIPVETVVVQMGAVVDTVRATGTVFPRHDVVISSQTAGTVTAVYIEVGNRVKKGDPLVQVDPEMKELALRQAEARLLEARAAFEKAKRDLERHRKLFESKDISEFVYESARLQKESAEAAYLTAKANVQMARRQLKDARIESPVDGFVAARLVDLGTTVAPGAPVAKVVDIDEVKVKFGVPERDVVKIAKGQVATVRVDALKGRSFTGTVSAVGPQADLATRTFPVEVVVQNPEHRLKAGMVARVSVAAGSVENLPLIPKSALLERAGETIVFVVQGEVAHKRVPELGLESNGRIAVLAGVEPGDQVVVLGQENLVEGTRVKVVAQPDRSLEGR